MAYLRARYGLSQDEVEEFTSVARLRLIENDAAVLRSFRGESSLRTYMGVVGLRMFLDWRDKLWGKWRPSAAARRLGGAAIELERLIRRDGLPPDEAVRMVGALHPEWKAADLQQTAAEIAARPPGAESARGDAGARSVRESGDLQDVVSSDPSVEDRLEKQETVDRVTRAVTGVLRELSNEDRLIVRMHFQDGLTLAAVSRALQLDQKSLYARTQRIVNMFREELLRHGVGAKDAAGILGRTDVDLSFFVASKENSGKPMDGSVQGGVNT